MNIEPVGALRRHLTIEAATRGTDDGAAALQSWTAIGSAWAAVMPATGREIVTADGQASRVTHRIQMRWRDDVVAAMRLRDGAAIYDIRAVFDADGRRRRLVCLAEERAP